MSLMLCYFENEMRVIFNFCVMSLIKHPRVQVILISLPLYGTCIAIALHYNTSTES